MSARTRRVNHNETLLCALSLTKEVRKAKHLIAILHPQAHYQLVPGLPQLTSCQHGQLLTLLVEASRGRVIDITLPYERHAPGKLAQVYLGRHVFIDGKLKGIKLASSSTNRYGKFPGSHLLRWPHGLVEEVSAPTEIVDARFQTGLTQAREKYKVPIGDFLLALNNATIALLFQS
jgi:hypothetical protein